MSTERKTAVITSLSREAAITVMQLEMHHPDPPWNELLPQPQDQLPQGSPQLCSQVSTRSTRHQDINLKVFPAAL